MRVEHFYVYSKGCKFGYMKGANNTYFGSVKEAVKTTITGAKLTVKHLKDAITKERRDATTADASDYFSKKEGIVTLQYPKEQLPVPDNGRYKLHNEMDDCIVCDKCAKICPVDCIDIEPIKSTETFGKTSDGTPKRLYAAKFDIDMAKCCFCGLCTTVCPTECLTMTKDYDFSTFDITEMNFGFANLTAQEANEKREAYEKAQEAKKSQVQLDSPNKKPVVKKAIKPTTETAQDSPKPKPVFKPKMKARPVIKKKNPDEISKETATNKPVYKPKMKAKLVVKKKTEQGEPENKSTKPIYKPKIKPVIKAKKAGKNDVSAQSPKSKDIKPSIDKTSATEGNAGKKPVYKPKMKVRVKPVIKKKSDEENKDQND